MATDLPRFTITLPEEMYNRVTQYKEEQKISTQSKAIQKLIAVGLESVASKEAKPEPLKIEPKYKQLDGHGRRVVDLVVDAELSRVIAEARETPVYDLPTIRHYLYSPAAGPDGMISGEDYEDIPVTPETPKNADFCLTVSGESMEPVLHDGQIIYISESEPVQPLNVGVFYFHGAVYVKQYGPEPDGSIILLSSNPMCESMNVIIPAEAAPGLVCYGKVLGIKKRLPKPIYSNGNL